MKPGIKTTEFWLSLLAVLLGGAYAVDLVPTEGIWAKLAGLAAVTLTAFGYTVMRGKAKAAVMILLCFAIVGSSACSVTYHDKRTVFQPGSIISNAGTPPSQGAPIFDAEGNVIGFAEAPNASGEQPTGFAAGTQPSGSAGGAAGDPVAGGARGAGAGDTRTGAMGSWGFIIVSIGQNDGVEQKTDAAASAAANLNSPGATAQPGTASGGSSGGGGGSGSGSGSADVTKTVPEAGKLAGEVATPVGEAGK